MIKRIGIFYDGNYFNHISNFYNYNHTKESKIDIVGLQKFIKKMVANQSNVEEKYCHINQSHFFRGRLSAKDAKERGDMLYYDRIFDDVLMSSNIIPHFYPINSFHGKTQEKDITNNLSIEALDTVYNKKIDTFVLVGSNGNYTPIIQKLNNLGIESFLVNWEFEYTNDFGDNEITKTSQELTKEITHNIQMYNLIEMGLKNKEEDINNIFLNQYRQSEFIPKKREDTSEILSVNEGYGFIKYPPNNLYFNENDVIDGDFYDLTAGDVVKFQIIMNNKGEFVANEVELVSRNDRARHNEPMARHS